MRHRKKTVKLGRTSEHRRALLASLVCGLIIQKRIRTTLAKAKAARPVAEKMVTLGKEGTLAARRRALAKLRQKAPVTELFSALAPSFQGRAGGYTRILHVERRTGDNAPMALLEWVDYTPKPKPVKKKKDDKPAAPDAPPAAPPKEG